MLSVVNEDGSTSTGSLIDEIVREGARRMLAAALEAEVDEYIAELAAARDERGRRLVARNGHHRPRTVTTAAGPVEVRVPRVNDRRVDEETGERHRFSSKILPPWCRKSPKISEVLPLLHLHGLSSGDFVPALEQFLGSSAGLSAATVTRLTRQWQDDHAAFQNRDLAATDYVYVWADGVHPKVRLGQAHSCVLVLMGVRLDGTKELMALAEGLRESTESWADLLRDCRPVRPRRPSSPGSAGRPSPRPRPARPPLQARSPGTGPRPGSSPEVCAHRAGRRGSARRRSGDCPGSSAGGGRPRPRCP